MDCDIESELWRRIILICWTKLSYKLVLDIIDGKIEKIDIDNRGEKDLFLWLSEVIEKLENIIKERSEKYDLKTDEKVRFLSVLEIEDFVPFVKQLVNRENINSGYLQLSDQIKADISSVGLL